MSLKERLPRTPGLKGAIFSEPVEDSLDGSAAENDRVLGQLALNLGKTKPRVELLDGEHEVFDLFGYGLTTGSLVRKGPTELEEVAIPGEQGIGLEEDEGRRKGSPERDEKGKVEAIKDGHPRP